MDITMNLHDEQEESRIDRIEDFFIRVARVVNAVFTGVNALIINSEYSFLNLVAVLMPWVVFLAPAYMTYTNSREHLGFSHGISLSLAIVAEGLGVVAGYELIRSVRHNKMRENRSKEKRVNTFMPGLAVGFYLANSIMMNALLDVYGSEEWARVAARIMIALMGGVAIMIVVVRGDKHDINVVKKNRHMQDSSGNYVTYDYRNEIGNIMGVEQKAQLLEMGKKKLKRWIMANWKGINPEIAVRWIRFIQRDVEEG